MYIPEAQKSHLWKVNLISKVLHHTKSLHVCSLVQWRENVDLKAMPRFEFKNRVPLTVVWSFGVGYVHFGGIWVGQEVSYWETGAIRGEPHFQLKNMC